MKRPIAITSIASFSPLGKTTAEVWKEYLNPKSLIVEKQIGSSNYLVVPISDRLAIEVEALRNSESKYKPLDNSVLYAILASREAVKKAGWKDSVFGVNIGSSRGATQLFEKYHQEFLETGKTPTLASPTTTLGNISTWVAHDLKSNGPELSHSITCSTALHALLNGIAWLQAGMADTFLVGGSEAPLTAFTIAQMQALKIYAKTNSEFPCRAFDLHKTNNSMVLGEGAAMACLEIGEQKNALGYVTGFGYATDDLQHSISITDEAECFQKSMKMALQNVTLDEVDVIVMHAPGTIKGDKSEYKAIQKVFGNKLPMLTTNKWKVGHTFGASGILNLEMALLMMQHQQFIGVPFVTEHNPRKAIRNVLINAVGFGGNAVSILVSK
ncbi:beta-ketoacyl synthase N-terminal-like domain-containing protein [Flavobacterium paronense]|uniref:Beta-ketoacyl synthase N-terminal-like domain-containing protein n=1 Tax=Flavobacterium paronense TaxID=1392775 RepID=A0ABV5GFA1_9FLAO|nr:beta-ketoacyl synthase N-terminal-like domain-containing protein [Flavobacterium paronense]MDN3678264.1 beta-ketoacyl synthase N-terminal-like domain-containing protein [Flavobacterium paronense]